MIRQAASILEQRPALVNVPKMLIVALVLAAAVLAGFIISTGHYLLVAPLIALPLIAIWPIEFALGVFAMLIPFEAAFVVKSTSGGNVSVTWFAGAMALGILFMFGLGTGRMDKVPRPAYWFGAFLIWQTLTTAWALDAGPATRLLPTAWSLYLLYLVGSMVRISEKEFRAITRLCILGGCAAAAYVLLTGQTYGGVAEQRATMAGSAESDPNEFAATLLLPISFALAAFFDKASGATKLLMGSAFLLLVATVFRTMSRGALVAIIVMTLVYMVRLRVSIRRAAAIGVAIIALAFLATPDVFLARLSRAANTGGSGRTYIWMAGLHSMQQHGIVGAGFNNFPVAYDPNAGFAPDFQGFARAPHNIYLAIGVESGVLGLLLFGIAIWTQFRRRDRVSNGSANWMIVSSEATCAALLAAGFFLDLLWRKQFWLAFLLLTVAQKLSSARQAALAQHDKPGSPNDPEHFNRRAYASRPDLQHSSF